VNPELSPRGRRSPLERSYERDERAHSVARRLSVLVGGLLGSIFGSESCSSTPVPRASPSSTPRFFRPDFSGDTPVGVSSFLEKRWARSTATASLGASSHLRQDRFAPRLGRRRRQLPRRLGHHRRRALCQLPSGQSHSSPTDDSVENNAGVGFDKLLLVRKPRPSGASQRGGKSSSRRRWRHLPRLLDQGATDFDACDKRHKKGNRIAVIPTIPFSANTAPISRAHSRPNSWRLFWTSPNRGSGPSAGPAWSHRLLAMPIRPRDPHSESSSRSSPSI